MIVKELSYSESQKVSTGRFETLSIYFSATAEPHPGQSVEDATSELIKVVKDTIGNEVSKIKKAGN